MTKMIGITAVAGFVLCCGVTAGAANQKTALSIDPTPQLAMAAPVSGSGAVATWENMTRTFRGKQAFVVISEGPPERLRAVHDATVSQSGDFYLYADHNSRMNHFKPIGYMGDHQDLKVDEANSEDPADGRTCLKFVYTPSAAGPMGWAGVYWLDPKSNWSGSQGGFNLTGMKRLTFWARGANGGEQIALFKVGGIGDASSGRDSASIGPVWLTREWKRYTIDLNDTDLTRVTGGFAWSTDGSDNVGPLAFYLDEIRYEQ